MNAGNRNFPPTIWILVLTLILFGQKTQPQKPLTRAEDGPGFGILEQAQALDQEGLYEDAFKKALEANLVFRQNSEWEFWGKSYELAFQCARKSDSDVLYHRLLKELNTASQILNFSKEIPIKTQALIWRRMGSIQHFLGDYESAGQYYEKALPFAEQAADTALMLRIYGNYAIVIWHQGDDYRSLGYFDKTLSLAAAQHDTSAMAAFTIHLGDVWRTLDPPKSIAIYQKVLALMPNDPETLTLLSKAYLEAESNYDKALKMAKASLHFSIKPVEKADALHQLGRVFYSLKKYDQALSYYDQAYEFAKMSPGGYGKNHPECAKINLFRGMAFLEKQDFNRALRAYNQTLDDLLPLFTSNDTDKNPTISELTKTSVWILDAFLGKAKVYERMFYRNNLHEDLIRSLECAELALYYQNELKLRYGEDESKFALNDYFISTCDAALHSAFLLYKRNGLKEYSQRAFNISEQMKSVVLAEALYKKEMKQVANVPTTFLNQERQIQQQIAYFEKKLTQSSITSEISILKDSLFLYQRQLEIQDKQIQDNYPVYAEALFSYRNDISADSVRQNLPGDVALLEFFMGDSAVYTFLLTKDTFWVEEQAIPKEFDQAATTFLRTVNDWRFVADSSALASKMFLDNSHLLYQWLLEKPLTVTKARRLFIIPDGKLGLIPFELLLTKTYNGQWIDRDVPFLIKDRTVSYRFSARKQSQKRSDPDKGWGGFGLEYDEAPLSAVDQPDQSKGLRDYGPLPFADDEIMAIKNVMGGAFWLNHDATRENFLKNAEHYGILHLAMHGVVDERNPLRSRLLFSTSVSGGDPSVYASDLYNLQLQAGLSVLSACQSGTGVWKKGEGVMSLARAFAFAGCPSMVMSLWNVSDQSTSELMVSFYQQLKNGATKDDALRTAKLNYLQTASPEYAKPIYWASFVPIGEMNSLPDEYFSNSKGILQLLLCTAILLILLIVGVIIRRSKRTNA